MVSFDVPSASFSRRWIKWHNEAFHNLYASLNIASMIKWVENVACMGEMALM